MVIKSDSNQIKFKPCEATVSPREVWKFTHVANGWAMISQGDQCMTLLSDRNDVFVSKCDPSRCSQRWKIPSTMGLMEKELMVAYHVDAKS